MKKITLLIALLVLMLLASNLVYAAEIERIDLHAGASKGPKNVKVVGDMAIKFTVPAGKKLVTFAIGGAPTWEKDDTIAELVLYRWNKDYATTLAGSPLETYREAHADNTPFILSVKGNYGEGVYLVLLAAETATNDIGAYTFGYKEGSNASTYIAGEVSDSMAQSYLEITDAPVSQTMDGASLLLLSFITLTIACILYKRKVFA